MNTNIWGPSAWRLIHSVSFTYPKNPTLIDKQRYKSFFESLAFTLPCVVCQFHYKKELLQFDLDRALRSREHLSRWAVDLHNSVNKRLAAEGDKRKKVMSYEEVRKIYVDLIKSVDKEKRENKEKLNKPITKNKLLCLVGLFGLGCLFYRYRKR
jgi:hypothetical protein